LYICSSCGRANVYGSRLEGDILGRLTVDGDGHDFAQDIAVAPLEGGNAAQLVELAVVIADALARVSLDKLDIEVVGLGDDEEGLGARILLFGGREISIACLSYARPHISWRRWGWRNHGCLC
jgi:hypothetical protein